MLEIMIGVVLVGQGARLSGGLAEGPPPAGGGCRGMIAGGRKRARSADWQPERYQQRDRGDTPDKRPNGGVANP
jgi:hypothetical protein